MKKSLVEVKIELCKKYRDAAARTKSVPRKKNWMKKSQSYAQQVVKMGGTV